MDNFLQQARERAERFGVRNVVVATIKGETVRHVRHVFGSGYVYFAVGNLTQLETSMMSAICVQKRKELPR